jgi:YspA, cpYpsA-related SLOG family
MRLLVCGDRNWDDFRAVKREIKRRMPEVVIEGEAPGADTMARLAAEELGIPVLPFPAQWEKFGRAAGPIRNTQMLDEGRPTEMIGFHSNINKSRGTKNMMQQCIKREVPFEIYTH